MRSLAVLAITLFIFSTHPCLARELNGNLEYSLKSEAGIAKLKITNNKTDTPVQIKSVAVIFPAENEEGQARIEIPISQSLLITESATIELGADSDLARQLLQIKYPNNTISQFKFTNVSEDDYCQLDKHIGYQYCKSIGFGIDINVEYENGRTKQNNLTTAFINYII
jgi:cytochrome bd-type quinol oxidase subunit 1